MTIRIVFCWSICFQPFRAMGKKARDKKRKEREKLDRLHERRRASRKAKSDAQREPDLPEEGKLQHPRHTPHAHPCHSPSAGCFTGPESTGATQDAMVVDEDEVATPTAVGIESGAFNFDTCNVDDCNV